MNKVFALSIIKPIVLFVSGLYLVGFAVFPVIGVGNLQIVRSDVLFPSEIVGSTILGFVLMGWGLRNYVAVARDLIKSARVQN